MLFNSKLEFIGSGQIIASVDTILFSDTHMAEALALSQAGHAGLDVRFTSASILGALNELMDGLTETSGNVSQGVTCYTEAVDTEEFVHTLTHGMGTLALTLQMYNADPASGPVATNVMTAWTPVDENTVRVELDSAASGFFVVMGCPV